MAKFGKSYADTEEYGLRFATWFKRDQEIKHLNATQTTSTHGHNHISDWTAEERVGLTGMKNVFHQEEFDGPKERKTLSAPNQSSVDWVTVTPAVVNPVQDQGQCGSCWAFSATATQESSMAIQFGTLYKFAEQNYVSCSFKQGNLGCNGGMYGRAWNYAKNSPVEFESDYPYTSGTTMKSGSCMYNASLGHGGVVSHATIATDNTSIMAAIATMPVSVAIEADTAYFQTYTSGVLTCASCCGTTLDHAVVAVGYGTDATAGPYYLVRNSWSATWGDQGYVKIGQAPAPGICGINQDVMTVETFFQ
jgi:C1A family cysteine protease